MAANDLQVKVGANISNFERGMNRVASVAKQKFSTVSRYSKYAALGLGALGLAATKMAADFEMALKLTAAVAGATGAEYDKLSAKARELGRTTAFTAEEAAKGMYGFASAGFKTKEIINAIGHSLRLAGALAYDMAQTTDLVAASLMMFGLQAKETERVVDVYTNVVTNSMMTMEKFTFSMQYAGPVARAFGESIEEVAASLGVISNLGLVASRIGTTYRMVMNEAARATIELGKGVNDTALILQRYGITQEEINPSVVGFIGLLKTVSKTTMTAAEGMIVFGRRAGAAFITLARQLAMGKLKYGDLLKAIEDGVGRTASLYDEMLTSLVNQYRLARSAAKDLAIEMYKTYEGPLRQVLAFSKAVFNSLRESLFDSKIEIRKWWADASIVMQKTALGFLIGMGTILDYLSPVLDFVADSLIGLWRIFKILPPWVQTAGIIGAFMFGKIGVGIALVLGKIIDKVYEFSKVMRYATDEGISGKNMAMLTQKVNADMARANIDLLKLTNQQTFIYMKWQKDLSDIYYKFEIGEISIEAVEKFVKEYTKEMDDLSGASRKALDNITKQMEEAAKGKGFRAFAAKTILDGIKNIKKYVTELENLTAGNKELQDAFGNTSKEVGLTEATFRKAIDMAKKVGSEIGTVRDEYVQWLEVLSDPKIAEDLAAYLKIWGLTIKESLKIVNELIKEYDEEILSNFRSMQDEMQEILLDEFDYERYLAAKKYEELQKEYKDHKEQLVEIDKWYQLQLQDIAVEEYNEATEKWNETVQGWSDTFKDLFIQSTQSDWEGWSDYWEDILDRMRNAFLDWTITLISDWAFGLLKMKAASAAMNILPGGSMASPAGGGVGGSAGSMVGGFAQNQAYNMGGRYMMGKAGFSGAGLMTKVPYLGSMLTTTPTVYGGMGAGVTAIGSVEGGGVLLSNGAVVTQSGLGAGQASLGAPAWASGVGAGAIGVGIGGIAGGLAGNAIGKSRGYAAQIGSSAAIGGGVGAGAGAAVGAMMGGIGMGAMVGGIGGLVMAVIMAVMQGDQVEAAREAKGKQFLTELDSWMGADYTGLGDMMRKQPKELRSQQYLNYAQEYADAPGGETSFMVQGQFNRMYDVTNDIGESSAAAVGSVNLLGHSIDAFHNIVQYESEESAAKMAEFNEKIREMFKGDVLESFGRGLLSLKNTRKELQNLGMEDAETASQLYETALASLFNKTLPLGTVQLERLYGDIKELKDDMEDAEATATGMNIAMQLLASGVEMTGEQLERLRGNADNLQKLEWLNVYEAMGIDQIPLAEENIENLDDAIAQMRASLELSAAGTDNFMAFADSLPDALGNTKEAIIKVTHAMDYFNNTMKEITDVIEDFANIEETFEDLKKAMEAGDIGAIADSFTEINLIINDVIEATIMLQGAFQALGAAQLASQLAEVAKILTKISTIIQAMNYILVIIQLVNTVVRAFWDWKDALAEINEKTEDWKEQKQKIFDNWIVPLVYVGAVIGNIIGYVMTLGGLLGDANWGELWAANQLENWEDILGLNDAKDVFADIKEWLYNLGKISKETFQQMTISIQDFLDPLRNVPGALEAKELGRDVARYLDYILDNWEELVKTFDKEGKGEEIVLQMAEDARDAYLEMLDDLVEASIKPWVDFFEQLEQEIANLDNQIIKYNAMAAGMSPEMGEWVYQMKEMKRYAELAAETWKEYLEEDVPAKKLELAKEHHDYLINAMNAELAANTAHHAELRNIAQERYDTEVEAIQAVDDALQKLIDRKTAFTDSIQDTLDDVYGGDNADGFNQARRDIEKFKELVATTEGEAKLDALEGLKDAYQSLWKYGKGTYEEGSEAYRRLQEEVSNGLEDLLAQGEEEFDKQIDILQKQLDVLTGGLSAEGAIAQKTEALKAKLEAIDILEAGRHAAILESYRQPLIDIANEINAQKQLVEEDIRNAFQDGIDDILEGKNGDGNGVQKTNEWLEKIWEALTGETANNGGGGATNNLMGHYQVAPSLGGPGGNSPLWSTITSEIDTWQEVRNAFLAMANQTVGKAQQDFTWLATHLNASSEAGVLKGSIDALRSYSSVFPNSSIYNDLLAFLQDVLPNYQQGTNYVQETGPAWVHQGETITPTGAPPTFIFVPYGTSEAEQDRIFNEEVKPRLLAASENEQVMYDRGLIVTNKGI